MATTAGAASGDTPATAPERSEAYVRERMEAAAAVLRDCAVNMPKWGSPLYGSIAKAAAEDPAILEIATYAPRANAPLHLFMAVHYLLMRDPGDRLACYYRSLTDDPLPADEAYPEFARFCAERRDELLAVVSTRTVQQTYVERCGKIVPLVAHIAGLAGEPVNLIELGCSAGVLLTFDKYAYDLGERGVVGPADAPITLHMEMRGGSVPRMPAIGKRVGIDLQPIDVRQADERLWLLAQTFPETVDERARLAMSCEVIRNTPIELLAGDGLAMLPRALAMSPDPVCVFHSACLMYWSAEAREALEAFLREASHEREIHRFAVEPGHLFAGVPERAAADDGQDREGKILLARYDKGRIEQRIAAYSDARSTFFEWAESDPGAG